VGVGVLIVVCIEIDTCIIKIMVLEGGQVAKNSQGGGGYEFWGYRLIMS
jgi:hypothetical protein